MHNTDKAENMTGKQLAEYFRFLPQPELQAYVLRGNHTAFKEMKARQKLGQWDTNEGMVNISALEYTFFGVTCSQTTFAEYLYLKLSGQCPFCGRTGLTARYGSDRKHIAACAKKKLSNNS